MKVAVIFIGTEKYLNFLPAWYQSCEEFLLPDAEKKYIIFTDGEVPESPDNSIVYHQEHLEWPYITLYRFKMIQKCFEDIQDCDWLLFLDADMRVVDTVNPEVLFDESKKYIGVHQEQRLLEILFLNGLDKSAQTFFKAISTKIHLVLLLNPMA